MTMTRPLRLITLHFSQIGFTEGFTFISSFLLYLSGTSRFSRTLHQRFTRSFETIGYTATGQVVRGKLNRDLIARQDANEIHADLT